MIEKVNPAHPDKIADRIAGAIVDLAYKKEKNPKIAVEVMIGHNVCHIIVESSVEIMPIDVKQIVWRITQNSSIELDYQCVRQDKHLADNQSEGFKCGDNGIFKGVPLTREQRDLSSIARAIYNSYRTDGKYILDYKNNKFIICQSFSGNELNEQYPYAIVNPLGYWTGGIDVDTGVTNRKLGSDMADSVTGGGLHGKDLSKADVSVNIYAFLKAQETGKLVEICCAIGDDVVDGKPYSQIVDIARAYIRFIGGFEKFAEWGLY